MTDERRSARTAARRRRRRNSRILAGSVVAVLIAALVFVGTLAYPRIMGSSPAENGGRSAQSATAAGASGASGSVSAQSGSASNQSNQSAKTDKPATAPDAGELRVEAARQAAETAIGQYPGTWSVYLADLETGHDASAGGTQPLVAASLVKLYIMLTVFDGIEHGTIADDATIDANLTQMITVSSNDAANRLLAVIGGTGGTAKAIATVTDTAHRYGFADSRELRALTGAASGNAVENWTSARDCGVFLSKAYRGELVSEAASERMTDLLLGQTRRTKIPAGVPAGIQVANKTGELAAVQNDVAIVYGTHPYVLAVLANDVDESAVSRIASLSTAVYRAFEG